MTLVTLVIGAGAAGLAAAWAARRRGRDVTVVSAGVGASGFTSGALDAQPWDATARASVATPVATEIGELAARVGVWRLPAAGDPMPLLATAAGLLRPARGHDRALLDLGQLEGGVVLLPRLPRASWDADAIAATLCDTAAARARGLSFRATDLSVLRLDAERRVPDADLAARHDDADRLRWLATRIREGLARSPAAAVLLGPWLGLREPRAVALSELVGVPVGEALVGAGSPAGLRFEAARDRVLAELGVTFVHDRVVRLERDGARLVATLAKGRPIEVDGVILAIGGLTGGGVIYDPPEHDAAADLPPRGRVPFRLSVAIDDVELALAGERLDVVSSLQGPDFVSSAWPSAGRAGALEAVGVRSQAGLAAPGIAVAGDAKADRPRTMLEALAAGIRAAALV